MSCEGLRSYLKRKESHSAFPYLEGAHNPHAACVISLKIPCHRLLSAATSVADVVRMQQPSSLVVLELDNAATGHLCSINFSEVQS